MGVLSVSIQSLDDAKAGKPLVAGLNNENGVEADKFTAGLLENGTKGGQTVVMFVLQDKDGKHMFGQVTAKQFEGLIGAYLGVQERWKQPTDFTTKGRAL